MIIKVTDVETNECKYADLSAGKLVNDVPKFDKEFKIKGKKLLDNDINIDSIMDEVHKNIPPLNQAAINELNASISKYYLDTVYIGKLNHCKLYQVILDITISRDTEDINRKIAFSNLVDFELMRFIKAMDVFQLRTSD